MPALQGEDVLSDPTGKTFEWCETFDRYMRALESQNRFYYEPASSHIAWLIEACKKRLEQLAIVEVPL
jgi:hypothetical protein